ncbi:hypothetical protein C0991_003547 [Blastosporella zonata]|nr:hypothetical protein C0991_003547 [Blastosporella zonata]
MPRQRPIWLTRFLEMFPKKPFDSPAARAMEEFRVKLTKQMAHESNRPILPTSTLARRRHGDRVPRPQHMDANPLGPTFGPKYTRDEEDQPLHHVNDTYGGCARESQHPRPVRYRSPQHRHETSHKPKIPLWEEPYLFAGVRAMERPNTRDLVDENDEYLVSTRPPPNAVWSHNPRPQPLSMARGPRNNLWRPRAAPAQQEYHNHNFKRHSISLNGPVPLHSVHPESLQRNYPLYNPFVIRGINRLLDDHDEETEAYLDSHCPRSEALAAAKACPKHHVINRRAHDRFAEVRRLHSPPENRRRLDEATNDDFGDFPDCEMSRAMGLHTRM